MVRTSSSTGCSWRSSPYSRSAPCRWWARRLPTCSGRRLPAISSVAFAALSSGALVATVIDIRVRRIPNALTATMAGIGVGLAASGVSGISLGASFAGFMVGLLLMLPGHALGATGAGDVKFMAAVGAIVGPSLVVSAFLFTAIAGGLLAVAVASRRRRPTATPAGRGAPARGVPPATLAGTGRLMAGAAEARELLRTAPATNKFAYGPAIAVGSILA